MGLKEKFMENMMKQMSMDEKKEMMNDMTEKFFAGMSTEEKGGILKEMMGKMMGNGGGENGGMMGMMNMMMGGEAGAEGFNPMDMCKKMMASMGESKETAALATPEIRSLFEEWAQQMDDEILNLLNTGEDGSVDQLAARLNISSESVIYFLAHLARAGKINLKPERK